MEQGRAQPSTYFISFGEQDAMEQQSQWVGIDVSKASLDIVNSENYDGSRSGNYDR